MKIRSYIGNPILKPQGKTGWESKAVYNGNVIKEGKKYIMVYRAMAESGLSTIGTAVGDDRQVFHRRKQIITPSEEWDKYGCEDPRICKVDKKFYIFYTAIGGASPDASNIKIGVAITSDFEKFEKHRVTPFNAKAMGLFPKQIDGKWVAILTVNTDMPPAKIALAYLTELTDLWNDDFWRQWYWGLEKHEINLRRITSDQTEVGALPIETEEGWLLVYAQIQDYGLGKPTFGIEAVLLDAKNLNQIMGRTRGPLMIPQEDYELEGWVPNVIFPSGAILEEDQLFIYYGAADTVVAMAAANWDELKKELKKNGGCCLRLKRAVDKPIITPIENHEWEKKATFNPAAIVLNDKVYIVYRAMSGDNTSTLGLAISDDGVNISYRSERPIFEPSQIFEKKARPEVFSGCEDPRITRIGNRLFMCYTAYTGVNVPRVAFTSILVSDFLRGSWSWKTPVVISPPNEDNKDTCLFPETIGGKYVFYHRAGGRGIVIDYLDDLEFENNNFIDSHLCAFAGFSGWDGLKMGIAAPPIKTDWGWLLLYHGVHKADSSYRVGAILLEKEDPTKIVGRTMYPLLEPEMEWEKRGEVNNVVFPCGAVIKDGRMLVYYGGADKVIGVAVGDAQEIAKRLFENEKMRTRPDA